MRWEGHVARMGDNRSAYRVLVRKGWGLTERDHLDDIGVDGRTIMIMDIQEVGGGSTDWSDLAENKNRCRVLVSADRTFVLHKMWGKS